jgi:hypothetical protein
MLPVLLSLASCFDPEVREFQVVLSRFLLLHDFSGDSPFVAHFFSKTSLATVMAFTALGQPA